jgi:hypothetical protein
MNYYDELIEQKHPKKQDFMWLSSNTNLSEKFFEKNIHLVNWYYLSANPGLSEKFYKKYINNVNWITLSQNPSMSEVFFEKYINQCHIETLITNISLSDEFIKKYKNLDDKPFELNISTITYDFSYLNYNKLIRLIRIKSLLSLDILRIINEFI